MKSILIILFLCVSVYSQEDDRDTQGKDFWLTFMPNTHVSGNPTTLPFRDSLYIFMASNVPTTVTIDYFDGAGNSYSETIEIDDVFEYETFKLAWYDFELPDEQNDRWGEGFDYNQGRAPQSFHITSEEKITVIAHNQAVWSSDGMIVYPTPTLGNRYFVNSYNSFVQSFGFGGQLDFKSSQFAIVATEDNTEINIQPKYALSETGLDELTVSLDRGEVYLAQAQASSTELADLTGTYIESDKPIALFSGNERAYVPSEGEGSKDYLTAQMIPFESSGRRYVCLPFKQPDQKDPFDNYNDIFRVLAYYDNSEIYVNDELVTVLDRGELYEGITDTEALIVESNKTISVYQLKKSTNYESNLNVIGDPFMLLNVAESQFYNSYKIINFQSNELIGTDGEGNPINNEVYSNHYISFAIDKDHVNDVLFDFNPLDASVQFEEIPNSNYVWTTLEVDVGTHLLTAPIGFICYAYGYGYANSYGFVGGGLKLELLDHKTPTKSILENECYTQKGFFADSSYLDSGIDRIEVLSADNAELEFQIVGDSLSTLDYTARLIDEYNNGEIIYRVYDSFGLWLTDTISLKGFTVDLLPTEEPLVRDINPGVAVNRTKVFSYEIINYGDLEITINNIIYDEDNLDLINLTLPLTIQTNETEILQFEFTPNSEPEDFVDEIILYSDCSQRKIGDVVISTWTDVDQPLNEASLYENCNPDYEKGFEISIFDEGPRQFGLKSVEITQKDNLLISSSFAYPNFAEVKGDLIDPRQDGFIQIIAIDSADNEMIFEEVINGLTLRVGEEDQASLDFGEVIEKTTSCKTITLFNYGVQDMVIEQFDLGANPYFSVPAAQFPILVKAGSEYELEVCFKPEISSDIEEVDLTQILLEDCLVLDIDLRGIGRNYESESQSRCNLTVNYFSNDIPTFSFSDEARPNPILSTTNIRVGFPEDKNISLELFSTIGNKIETIYDGEVKAGITDLNLQFNDIDNGSYLLVIRADDFLEAKTIIIER